MLLCVTGYERDCMQNSYLHIVMSLYVAGYRCGSVGRGCGGGHVPTARSQRSSDAGEVYAALQCSHHQVSNLILLLILI